jgi:hypothetical protein
MRNAFFDAPLNLVTWDSSAPRHGDVLLAPQADGGCLIARHPGDWQMSFSSPTDAVGFAVRFASRNGARVWVQSVNNQYEPIDAAATTLAEANER